MPPAAIFEDKKLLVTHFRLSALATLAPMAYDKPPTIKPIKAKRINSKHLAALAAVRFCSGYVGCRSSGLVLHTSAKSCSRSKVTT